MLKLCLLICCFGKKKFDDYFLKYVCLNFILSLVLFGLLVFIIELFGYKLYFGFYGDSYIFCYSINFFILIFYIFIVLVVLLFILSLFVFFFIF